MTRSREHRRLTQPGYWESVHARARPGHGGRSGGSGGDYRQFLIDETALAPNLPQRGDWKALEVGSAPGHRLLHLHHRFGYQPYGVDYSLTGVERNRALFAAAGLDPANVFHADFFSDAFLREHREAFDVVLSHGFVEHFADPRGVVARHVGLLRPSGRLVIVIPNLRGANRLLARFFHPEVLALHHLEIMERRAFARLFEGLGLRTLHLGYVGFFSLGLQNTTDGSWKRHLLRLGWKVQAVVDLALWRLAGRRHPRSRWFSPYLVYVGEKSPPPGASAPS